MPSQHEVSTAQRRILPSFNVPAQCHLNISALPLIDTVISAFAYFEYSTHELESRSCGWSFDFFNRCSGGWLLTWNLLCHKIALRQTRWLMTPRTCGGDTDQQHLSFGVFLEHDWWAVYSHQWLICVVGEEFWLASVSGWDAQLVSGKNKELIVFYSNMRCCLKASIFKISRQTIPALGCCCVLENC